MKSIGTRFLVPFGLIAALFSTFILYETYEASRHHANGLMSEQASLALEFSRAIRDYAGEKIRPVMEGLVDKDDFIPETMSTSFISRAISEKVRKRFPNYITRFSSEYPRNPNNMAGPDELRMIEFFRKNPEVSHRTEELRIDGGRFLAHFTPRWLKEDCMRCHGDPKNAPASLIKQYGAEAGFYRKAGDVAGLDMVAVPLDAMNAALAREARGQSMILAAGLVVLFGLIIVAFRFVVTRRLAFMAGHLNEIAAHPESSGMTPVAVGRKDEIGEVAAAFNRLLKHLRDAHASLERRVGERTEELRKANEQLQVELAERRRAEEAMREREREANRLARENAIMAEIGSIINSSLDIDEVYERFAEELQQLIPFDRISINLVKLRENRTCVAYVSSERDIPGRRKGDAVSLVGGFSKHIIETRKGLLIPTEELDHYVERFPGLLPSVGAGFRSILSIPLISKDEVIAILHFRSRKPGVYSEEELRLAGRVGYQIGSAIANSLIYEEQKRAEQALREKDQFTSSLLEKAPFPIVVVNEDTSIRYVNPMHEKLTGYTSRETIGRKAPYPWWTEDQGFAAVHDQTQIFVEGISGAKRFFKKKTGEIFWVELTSTPLIGDEGPRYALAIWVDLTERNRAEEEKQILQARLQRAQKMEAIGTLAGGVAHDLNNILSGIVSYPDLLLMQLPEGSPFRKPISVMQESGKRAAAIVQDLLTLARRAVPTTDVVNLNEVIADYLRSPEHEKLGSLHPHVHVEGNLAEGVLNVLGSHLHLSKTLMNLILNAAEAMPDGGAILVSTENRYIDSPIRGYDHVEEGDYVTLSVSDTGVGISPADRERIFEPFYTKKVMGRSGTGLGMAVVWGTVKDHRGYIDVESAQGKGSTFTLYFPVTRKERVQVEPLPSLEGYQGRGESILVVDDVEGQREIAYALLSHLGYSVATVSSGEKAVEYVKTARADLIVLDMVMDPGIDGLETYKRILQVNPRQKAVIASGFSESARVKEAQKMGVGHYIRKPYTLVKLAAAVREELDGERGYSDHLLTR